MLPFLATGRWASGKQYKDLINWVYIEAANNLFG